VGTVSIVLHLALLAAPGDPGTVTPTPLPLPGPPAGAVALSEQRGVLDTRGAIPVLRLTARVQSSLTVPVEGVRVGVLYASDAPTLGTADPAALYKVGATPEAKIGATVQVVRVEVPPRGEARIEVTAPVRPSGPQPFVFQTHVLGFELGDVSAGLLFDLLATQAPSDEVAAVSALALDGDPVARLAARRRWASRAAPLVAGLAQELERRIPARPTEVETFRRVFAARALGVLGGVEATRLLRRRGSDTDLSRFDETLQVLRIARVIGSPLETPLAFAVPPKAQRMADVFAVALDDCTGLEAVEARVAEPAGAPGAPAASASSGVRAAAPAEVVAARTRRPPSWAVVAGTAAVTALALWLGVTIVHRRRARNGGTGGAARR
jgi:hypothetical protein